jgi:hypothetical protein
MEHWTFQYKATPADHQDLEHAVADFKRALNASFPRVIDDKKQQGRFITGASLVQPYDYSLDVYEMTQLTDGQFYKIVDGFRRTWQSANSARDLS